MFDQHAATYIPVQGDRIQISAPFVELRDYQQMAIKAIGQAEGKGNRRQVIVLPTGAGKTIVFASLIAERSVRSLVLAHREELVEQAVDKIRVVIPGAPVGVVQAGRDEWWSPIVVASVPTIARQKRLDPLLTQNFGLVIVDECHHARAETWMNVIGQLRAGDENGPLLIGVTATPQRGDNLPLEGIFQEITYSASMVDLIARGYLSDLTAVRIVLERINLDNVKTQGGDFQDKALSEALMNADQPIQTAMAVREHAANRKSIVFCASVALAEETAHEISAQGIKAEFVSGETPRAERRDIIQRFRLGDTDCLVNCMLFTEGFDVPEVDCIVVARPTTSRGLYQQMVGRGMRVAPGKDNCLVIDVVGVTDRHKLETVESLAGYFPDPSLADESRLSFGGKSMLEAMQDLGSMGIDPTTGKLVAIPKELFDRSKLRWHREGTSRQGSEPVWMMPFDRGTYLAIAGDLFRGWGVWKLSSDGAYEVLLQNVDGSTAQAWAEDHARKHGARYLTDRDARWLHDDSAPATDAQLKGLYQRGINADLLKNGEGIVPKSIASQAISEHEMKRMMRIFARARQRA